MDKDQIVDVTRREQVMTGLRLIAVIVALACVMAEAYVVAIGACSLPMPLAIKIMALAATAVTGLLASAMLVAISLLYFMTRR